MNLTLPFEVLKHTPAGFDYPTDTFCFLIPQIEQELTRECLGDELWDFLQTKLTTYPTVFTEWDGCKIYGVDDVAIRNETTYISLEDYNQEDPLSSEAWEKFERFTHAGSNELWEGYLRLILCMKVYTASLPHATFRTGAGGMVVNQGDPTGFRSANKTEMLSVVTQNEGIVRMTTENMVAWLNKNAVDKGLPVPICGTGCEVPGRRSRRWAFR